MDITTDMRRRSLLQAIPVAATGGCAAPSFLTDPACGPAHRSVSDRLIQEPAATVENCTTPDMLVANEQPEAVDASLTVEDTPITNRRYGLGPGEQTLEEAAFQTFPGQTVTVEIADAVFTDRWSKRSCYRSAIVIRDRGILTGWLGPLAGLPDGQHDCYTGDPASLRLHNVQAPDRRVTVTCRRPCTGESWERTVEAPMGRSVSIDGVLVSGGRFTGTVSVQNGPTKSFEFPRDANCWGIIADITPDETLEFRGIPVF